MVLATRNRLRTSTDFSTTVRSGVRNGRRNLVLYTAPIAADQPTRIGFIVSKAIGNAVTRNLVKRRLRAAGALSLGEHGTGLAVVVRALPAAANATWEQLLADYDSALNATTKRLSVSVRSGNQVAPPVQHGTTQEGTPRA